MILFRQATRGVPFFWEGQRQPAARWHRSGEGPVQYLADTPDGAWAEFLRHEGITDAADLAGISRTMWAVSVDDVDAAIPLLRMETIHGNTDSYEDCQAEAANIRARGHSALSTTSAALSPGAARGWKTDEGLKPGPDTDGRVYVLFGTRPDSVAWKVVEAGGPPDEVLSAVRQLNAGPTGG